MSSCLLSDFVVLVLVLSPPRRTEYEYEKNRETKHWTEVLD
jgi:hypothetical protein